MSWKHQRQWQDYNKLSPSSIINSSGQRPDDKVIHKLPPNTDLPSPEASPVKAENGKAPSFNIPRITISTHGPKEPPTSSAPLSVHVPPPLDTFWDVAELREQLAGAVIIALRIKAKGPNNVGSVGTALLDTRNLWIDWKGITEEERAESIANQIVTEHFIINDKAHLPATTEAGNTDPANANGTEKQTETCNAPTPPTSVRYYTEPFPTVEAVMQLVVERVSRLETHNLERWEWEAHDKKEALELGEDKLKDPQHLELAKRLERYRLEDREKEEEDDEDDEDDGYYSDSKPPATSRKVYILFWDAGLEKRTFEHWHRKLSDGASLDKSDYTIWDLEKWSPIQQRWASMKNPKNLADLEPVKIKPRISKILPKLRIGKEYFVGQRFGNPANDANGVVMALVQILRMDMHQWHEWRDNPNAAALPTVFSDTYRQEKIIEYNEKIYGVQSADDLLALKKKVGYRGKFGCCYMGNMRGKKDKGSVA